MQHPYTTVGIHLRDDLPQMYVDEADGGQNRWICLGGVTFHIGRMSTADQREFAVRLAKTALHLYDLTLTDIDPAADDDTDGDGS